LQLKFNKWVREWYKLLTSVRYNTDTPLILSSYIQTLARGHPCKAHMLK